MLVWKLSLDGSTVLSFNVPSKQEQWKRKTERKNPYLPYFFLFSFGDHITDKNEFSLKSKYLD